MSVERDTDVHSSSSLNPSSSPNSSKKWAPIAFVAGSTVLLTVPLVLMLSQRRKLRTLSLNPANAGPPPRRVVSNPAPTKLPPPLYSQPQPAAKAAKQALPPTKDASSDPLLGAGAFGIATCIVFAGGAATVLGLRAALGVNNTEEFSRRMRIEVLNRMPIFAERIHGPISSEDVPHSEYRSSTLETEGEVSGWSWAEAEARLKRLYETHGALAWLSAAMVELENEAKVERRKRDAIRKGVTVETAG